MFFDIFFPSQFEVFEQLPIYYKKSYPTARNFMGMPCEMGVLGKTGNYFFDVL
jgi:hypothetical protein